MGTRSRVRIVRFWPALLSGALVFAVLCGCSPGKLSSQGNADGDSCPSDSGMCDGSHVTDASNRDSGLLGNDGPTGTGHIYYVATDGNDLNSCTAAQSPSSAKQTISGGIHCMSGGDTLIVKAGFYAEGQITNIPSGSPEAPTTIKANGNAFLGTGDTVELRVNDHSIYAVRIENASYIVFDGFIIDARDNGSYDYVVGVLGDSHHITIQNNEVRNTVCAGKDGAGITTDHTTHHSLIRSNNVHHIGNYDNPGCVNNLTHGLYVTGSDESIENNVVHDNVAFGIHHYATQIPINRSIDKGNIIYRNGGVGLLLSSGGDDNMAYNNIIYSNGAHGIAVGGYGLDAHNNTVFNNTLYDNHGSCIKVGSQYGSAVANTTVRNNIRWQNGYDGIGIGNVVSGTVADHNLLGMNPLFVNAAGADFSLPAGSMAIDAGVDVDLPYNGSAPDLGALESP